ncbi:MAG: DUF3883 domain-containing protein [Nitrosopumilus sp.]
MKTIFENLTKRQIRTFIEIQVSTKSIDFSFIKNKYLKNEINFDSLFNYLKAIGLYSRKKDKIVFKKNQIIKDFSNEEKLNSFLIEKTLNNKASFSDYVFSYLQKFDSVNGSFQYKPMVQERLKASGLRNFLIDIDLIYHNRRNNSYIVNDKYIHLFTKQIETKTLSPKNLNSILKNQKEIGYLAELEILKYEKKRLKDFSNLSRNIEHISKFDVNAGFDIKSWETNKKERYIEVKAVSIFDFKFHWSRNEIKKSQSLKNKYYLYLLPIITNKNFDIASMEIIKNPFSKVFSKSSYWENQIEQYSFWKEN